MPLNQKIIGFHQDFENHWVAELNCGHSQHVRHDPPWQERPWVLSEEGRQSRLGLELQCKRCDETRKEVANAVLRACRKNLMAAYENAGLSGLCAEGKWEMALDSLNSLDLETIFEMDE